MKLTSFEGQPVFFAADDIGAWKVDLRGMSDLPRAIRTIPDHQRISYCLFELILVKPRSRFDEE